MKYLEKFSERHILSENFSKHEILREVFRKDVPFSELSIEEQALLVDAIEEVSESLDLISLGSDKPHFWQEYKTDSELNTHVFCIVLPGLSAYKNLTYIMCWRAKIKAEDGEHKQAFDDLLICYRLGMHQKKGATLLEQLVGVAIEAKSVQTLRFLLSTHKIPKAEVLYYRDKLAKVVENESFRTEMKFEKYVAYDEIQRCYTGKRLGGLREGAFCLEGIRRIGMSNDYLIDVLWSKKALAAPFYILFTYPNKEESFEMTNAYWDYWDKVVDKSPAQLRAGGIDTDKESMEIIKDNILLEILAPAMTKVIQISYRNKIEVESTLVLISILLYEQDFGRLPENLEELVLVGYLKTIAIDPFSDKPLVYRKTDDGFTLYSVGENFKDDGGQFGSRGGKPKLWGSEGDAVFWPVGK